MLSGWESFTPPGQVSSSRRWYSFTWMESWVSLGGKEGLTNIQISAEKSRGANWGPCGRKAEILPTAPTMSADHAHNLFYNWSYVELYIFLPGSCTPRTHYDLWSWAADLPPSPLGLAGSLGIIHWTNFHLCWIRAFDLSSWTIYIYTIPQSFVMTRLIKIFQIQRWNIVMLLNF